jgi:hypothetical protein
MTKVSGITPIGIVTDDITFDKDDGIYYMEKVLGHARIREGNLIMTNIYCELTERIEWRPLPREIYDQIHEKHATFLFGEGVTPHTKPLKGFVMECPNPKRKVWAHVLYKPDNEPSKEDISRIREVFKVLDEARVQMENTKWSKAP